MNSPAELFNQLLSDLRRRERALQEIHRIYVKDEDELNATRISAKLAGLRIALDHIARAAEDWSVAA
jgi:hypothetical protein